MKFRARQVAQTLLLPAALLMLMSAACGSDKSPATTPGATRAVLSGDITVFAAASLTDSFKELGKAFEAANSGTHVTFSFAGSATLATQITQGAPADVFASADAANMKLVSDSGVDGPFGDFRDERAGRRCAGDWLACNGFRGAGQAGCEARTGGAGRANWELCAAGVHQRLRRRRGS